MRNSSASMNHRVVVLFGSFQVDGMFSFGVWRVSLLFSSLLSTT